MAEELCKHCGAPRVAGYAACKFCRTPFVENSQTNAIPCPRCNTLNEMGAQKCVQCQTWVVVQCVFCGALSPHNVPGCLKCGEAFAGAPQRLQERQRQQHLQQGLQVAGTVGTVAASFLGAAAGAGMFSHHEHYVPHGGSHHHYGYGNEGEWIPEQPTGAGIAQSSESSGGGFFDSLFGGGSDDSGTGAGIASSSDDSGDSGDSGGFFGGDDD